MIVEEVSLGILEDGRVRATVFYVPAIRICGKSLGEEPVSIGIGPETPEDCDVVQYVPDPNFTGRRLIARLLTQSELVIGLFLRARDSGRPLLLTVEEKVSGDEIRGVTPKGEFGRGVSGGSAVVDPGTPMLRAPVP